MENVQDTVKASQFRQHLVAYLDASRSNPVIIERGKELYRLTAVGRRRALGTAPLPGLAVDAESLPDCPTAEWLPDDLS